MRSDWQKDPDRPTKPQRETAIKRTLYIQVRAVVVGVGALLALTFGLTYPGDHTVLASYRSFNSASVETQPSSTNAPREPLCGTSWEIVPSANEGAGEHILAGIEAVSSSDLWTVGHYVPSTGGAWRTLVERWDGSQWRIVPSPNLTAGNNHLGHVTAVSATDVWAAGYALNNGIYETLIIHWDGANWTIVSTPNRHGIDNLLSGISAVSATDIWAVGISRGTGPYSYPMTLALHWDGVSWTIVDSPNFDAWGGNLTSVAALSANDVWAVGFGTSAWCYTYAGFLHWNGSQWDIASSRQWTFLNYILSVSVSASNDVWAAGYTNTGTTSTLLVHWNGTDWYYIDSPSPGINARLFGVASISANDAWAVGRYYDTTRSITRALILHWNGTLWSLVSAPDTGNTSNYMWDVAALSGRDVWTVGHHDTLTGEGSRTLVDRYNPCVNTPTPTSTPTRTSSPTFSATPAPGTSTSTQMPSPTPTSTITPMGVSATPTSTSTHISTVTSMHTITRTRTSIATATGTGSPTPCIGSFSDVQPTDYFYQAVSYLACHGIVSGYANGTFGPQNDVTRGQVTKIVVLGFGIPINTIGGPHFTDLPSSNAHYAFVETAYNRGVISGYSDGTFGPQNNVTRGQLAKIVVLAARWSVYSPPSPTFSDVPAGSPFYPFVETAYTHNVISGYGCTGFRASPGSACLEFRPASNAARGQISKIVYQALSRLGEDLVLPWLPEPGVAQCASAPLR